MSKLNQVKENVKKILIKYPALRDDYTKLTVCYWGLYCDANSETTIRELYNMKLNSPESITRASRFLQNEFPELRGKKYGKTEKKEQEYKTEFKKS